MTAANGPTIMPTQVPGQGGPVFPKRFYTSANLREVEDGYVLELDGRPARTPGRKPLALPTRGLAEAVASEWAAVRDTIDPKGMPLTRLANSVIDGVTIRFEEVVAEIVRFSGSDLLLYRAAEPADLVQTQAANWDPVVNWTREKLGVALDVVDGVMFVAQPARSIEAFDNAARQIIGTGPTAPFRAGALHVVTTLTGSALLAVALASGRLTPDEAWRAAHVDEDFQIAQWGRDDEAAERRDARWNDMRAACELLRLTTDA